MNKAIYKFATVVVAALSLQSCSDFLDKEPSNVLTSQDVLTDWAYMEQFHYDTYNFLLHGALRINSSWLDSATDLAETSYGTGGTRTTFNIGNYYGSGGAAELTSIWESRYRGIRKCNMVLTYIDNITPPTDLSESVYQSRKANYKAEAKFFRAWFNWEMFLRYGPVPIVKEVLDPDGDLLTGYTTRPSIKAFVVDYILNDLEESKDSLLSYDDASGNTYSGRISQPMAYALIARIKLYMASPRYSAESGITWQDALDASLKFIEKFGDKYSLMQDDASKGPGYMTAWSFTPYGDKNTETIFYRNDASIGWSSISSDTPVGEGGSGGLCPSQNLIDMYDMADGSAPFTSYDATGAPVYDSNGRPTINTESGYTDQTMWENRDPRLENTVLHHGSTWNNREINVIAGESDNPAGNGNATPTGYYVKKWIPETILANEHSGTAKRLWKFIGLNEIYLNIAEATNEISGPQNDNVINMLDAIRSRAGITGSVANRSDLMSSQETMRNFIHKERTIELAFEEHRWWDCKRWNVAVEAFSRPIYGIDVAADGTITRKTAQTRTFESKMYLYPIPETEYWKTGIENNSGW